MDIWHPPKGFFQAQHGVESRLNIDNYSRKVSYLYEKLYINDINMPIAEICKSLAVFKKLITRKIHVSRLNLLSIYGRLHQSNE